MEAGRRDAMRVEVAGTVVEISLAERDALLGKIVFVAGCETIVAKFHAAGGRGPTVELDEAEQNYLHTALDVWEFLSELPGGLARLLDALAHTNTSGHVGIGCLER